MREEQKDREVAEHMAPRFASSHYTSGADLTAERRGATA